MSFLLKIFILFGLSIFLLGSCGNFKSAEQTDQKNKNVKNVEFTEIRRLNDNNDNIDLKEYTIINSTKGIKDLYDRFKSKFSRSAPIPVLEREEECFLVLKPRLKNIKYGDIKVEKLESDASTLIVTYREIENWEYAENKQSNPIVILKVFNRPNTIKFNQIQ